jgi:hypothetical protein
MEWHWKPKPMWEVAETHKWKFTHIKSKNLGPNIRNKILMPKGEGV